MRLLLAALFCTATLGLTAHAQSRAGANLIDSAKSAYQQEKFDVALATLDQLEKQNPPTGESRDLRGLIYLEQGKFEAATKAFQAAHEATPELFSPRLHLGDVLFRQKKYAAAREVYETLLRQTNILISNERLRFADLVTYLAEHDESGATTALARIKFPTESPAYYYAQAAWAFAHDQKSEGKKWIATADRIFDENAAGWFSRMLYDLDWIKNKPPLVRPP